MVKLITLEMVGIWRIELGWLGQVSPSLLHVLGS